ILDRVSPAPFADGAAAYAVLERQFFRGQATLLDLSSNRWCRAGILVQPDDHLPFSSFGCAWEAKAALASARRESNAFLAQKRG
ncbi:hypothetical protein C6506_28215, partial [Escherichia coli]